LLTPDPLVTAPGGIPGAPMPVGSPSTPKVAYFAVERVHHIDEQFDMVGQFVFRVQIDFGQSRQRAHLVGFVAAEKL
jgi:hypothetical protein